MKEARHVSTPLINLSITTGRRMSEELVFAFGLAVFLHSVVEKAAEKGFDRRWAYRFVEHAGLSVLVLSLRAVYEAVAQHMVVYTPKPTLAVWCWTGEPLHAVHCRRTLCKNNPELVRMSQWKSEAIWRILGLRERDHYWNSWHHGKETDRFKPKRNSSACSGPSIKIWQICYLTYSTPAISMIYKLVLNYCKFTIKFILMLISKSIENFHNLCCINPNILWKGIFNIF